MKKKQIFTIEKWGRITEAVVENSKGLTRDEIKILLVKTKKRVNEEVGTLTCSVSVDDKPHSLKLALAIGQVEAVIEGGA